MKSINQLGILFFSLLSGFVLFTSCSKDPKINYPEALTVEVHKIITMSMPDNDGLTIWIDDESVAKADFINDSLKIYPQKTGKVLIQIGRNEKSILMDCTVEIFAGHTFLIASQSDLYIELRDDSFREIIKQEIAELYPFNKSTAFQFYYKTRDEGEIRTSTTIEESGSEKITKSFKGDFRFTTDELIFVDKDGREDKYAIEEISMLSDGSLHSLALIKDYTDYFIGKYPEAGIVKACQSQVWDDSYWDQ